MEQKRIAALLAGAACVSVASALETPVAAEMPDTTKILNEVVVTGHRDVSTLLPIDAPDMYLPLSSTSVSQDMLRHRDINDITEAARLLPSVKSRTTYGGFQEFYIRGFSNQLIATDGVADQRSFVTSMPMHDLSNVESIEVLRGSASALYGQGIVGGVININRKLPTQQTVIRAKIGAGSWNTYDGFFSMSGRVAGPVSYYASIFHSDGDGWRHNREKRMSVYAVAQADFTPRDMLRITYSFGNDRYGTDTGLPKLMPYDIYDLDGKLYLKQYDMLPGLDRKARYNNESDFLINRTQEVNLRYEHKFSEAFKLRDVALYRYDNINYFSTERMDYPTSSDPIYDHYYMLKGEKVYIDLDHLINSAPLRFNHVSNTFANQLDLTGKFNIGRVANTYAAGYTVNYMHRPSFGWTRAKDISGPGVNSTIPVKNPYSGGKVLAPLTKVSITDRMSQSVFLSDLIEPMEQLKVMIAGRYDYYKFRSAPNIPLLPGTLDWDKPEKYSSVVNHAFSYRAGLV